MSQAMSLLKKTEEQLSALLVAGLGTRRGGREELDGLAGELAAMKMERLAAELRSLASTQEPAAAAGNAFTALAMARKFQERLSPWPVLPSGDTTPLDGSSLTAIALPAGAPATPDIPTLIDWMETGDALLRAHAAAGLVQKGGEALPELARLASKGIVAVRREAISAIGAIGGQAALGILAGLVGDIHCWRALLQAITLFGQEAIPPLSEAFAATTGKKGQEGRRSSIGVLLYRLGAFRQLDGLDRSSREEPVVQALALVSHARLRPEWEEPVREIEKGPAGAPFHASFLAAAASAEAGGSLDPLIQMIDGGAINEVRQVARWIISCTNLEAPLADHYLRQLSAGRAKDRDRAAGLLKGLANPAAVPRLVAMARAGDVPAATAAEILAATGGPHATGALLELAAPGRAGIPALDGLGQIGDPGIAPALLRMYPAHPDRFNVESALVALGDGAAPVLARVMGETQGTALAGRVETVLLQIKGPRARAALKDADPGSIDSLIPRLGHPKLGTGAAKALARHGEAALEPLEKLLSGGSLAARQHALATLHAMKGDRARDLLFTAVARAVGQARVSTEAAIAAHGLEILGRKPTPREIDLLVKGLATGVYQPQHVALEALARVGDEVVPLVMPLLDDPRAPVRAKALELLGRLAAPEAEDKAISLLGDHDHQVKYAAVAALGSIGAATGHTRVAEALGVLLMAEMSSWPYPIIAALVATGRGAAIAPLKAFAREVKTRNPGMGDYLARQALGGAQQLEATAPPPSDGGGLGGRLRRLLGGK